MYFLTGWSLSEISLALGILISIIGLIKPFTKWVKIKIQKAQNQTKTIESLPATLNKLSTDIQDIKESNKKQNEDITSMNAKVDNLDKRISDFERQEIVREVNNTFYSFDKLEYIPDDILKDTLDSCAIYIKNGYNHTTKPKCELLMAEYNRRLANKQEANHEQ
jgi:hypothetical protein